MIKLTEEEKDILTLIAEASYYAPLTKAIQHMVDAQAAKVLTKNTQQELWEAKLELDGAKKLQRDIMTLFRELRRGIKED